MDLQPKFFTSIAFTPVVYADPFIIIFTVFTFPLCTPHTPDSGVKPPFGPGELRLTKEKGGAPTGEKVAEKGREKT